MSKENGNKIQNTKFSVGDVVRLKSAEKQFVRLDDKGKSTSFIPEKLLAPYMVVLEIFVDDKIGKTLFSNKENTTEPKQIKDVGYPIRVKCAWFYEGKCIEKVFWQNVLEKI